MTIPGWLTKSSGDPEFSTSERCYITELMNSDASPEVSVAVARVEPGVSTQLHALCGVTESYIVKSGNGLMQVGHESHPVEAGDQVTIAADQPQRITNNGDSDLLFYCICTPRFTADCYINLEE